MSESFEPATGPAMPLVLAGPMLRRLEVRRLVFWLASRQALRVRLLLDLGDGGLLSRDFAPDDVSCRHLSAGAQLHYQLIDWALSADLPSGRWIGYSVAVAPMSEAVAQWQDWSVWAPDLCYPGQRSPGFVLMPQVQSLLHGSCRKPHHPGGDGLVRAERLLAQLLAAAAQQPGNGQDAAPGSLAAAELPVWPSALILSGDQIYADDVAGPMLRAIHQLIGRLDLPSEPLAGAELTGLADAQALYSHPHTYYRRETMLPQHQRNYALIEVLFGGVEKPVFTTDSAHNHLITLAEVLAMYLLVWSPVPWHGLDLSPPAGLDAAARKLYAQERELLDGFVADLPAVRRLLAHLPVAMIFDDHDITDDWNLSREWEEIAYSHPFSRRVIGNALLGYLVNQGWGNRPEVFDGATLALARQALAAPGSAAHEDCIWHLLRFGQWHYDWPTVPPLLVVDGRTHRWRCDYAGRQPSGLLDWEGLTDLQQRLLGHPAVLLVCAAPIFGVKLIEAIQRIFSWWGRPLLVDAENWMAHGGTASAILNILRHPKTPQNFVVLSGDVHYSFVYDVELRGRWQRREHRHRPAGPAIWQICCSGLRNEFPPRLLDALDRVNRWLYSPRSPLNWFTKRRHMRVTPRKPEGTASGRRLLNGSGVGLVEIDASGKPWRIRVLLADGRSVRFTPREAESRWD